MTKTIVINKEIVNLMERYERLSYYISRAYSFYGNPENIIMARESLEENRKRRNLISREVYQITSYTPGQLQAIKAKRFPNYSWLGLHRSLNMTVASSLITR